MSTAHKPTRAKALGIDDAAYDALLAAQGGHCAICPNRPKTRRLHVDHDHATGAVRGLLCMRCNRALPTWVTPEWTIAAAYYLGAALDTRAWLDSLSARLSLEPTADDLAEGVNSLLRLARYAPLMDGSE